MGMNAFAGDFFLYNSERRLILPDATQDYASMDRADRRRLDYFIKREPIKSALGEELVDNFRNSVSSYSGLIGWKDQYKSTVQTNLAELLAKIDELQNNPANAPLFSESRSDDYFHFDDNVDPEGIPDFCSYYPEIEESTVATYFGEENESMAYSDCVEGVGLVSVEVKDIATDYARINSIMLEENRHRAREQMLLHSAQGVLDSRQKYEGLFEGLPEISDEFKSCLESKKDKYPEYAALVESRIDEVPDEMSEDENKQLQETYLAHSASRALIAKHYLDEVTRIQGEIEAKDDEMADAFSGLGYIPSEEEINRVHQIVDDQKQLEVQKLQAEAKLEDIMNEAPTIFKLENDFEVFDWVNLQIKSNPFMDNILNVEGSEDLTSKLIASIDGNSDETKSFAQKRQEALQAVYDDEEAGFADYLSKVKEDENVKQSAKDQVSGHLSQLDASLSAICDNEGESLHHYSAMMPGMLKSMASRASSTGQAEEEIESTQAGICSLYREDPPGQGGISGKQVVGLGLILGGVIGGVITSPTGVGAVAGAGAVASGSGLIVHDAYLKHQQSKVLENNANAMAVTDWGSARDAIQARENRMDARNALVAEAALAIPDAVGLGLARRAIGTGARLAGAIDEAVDTTTLGVRNADLVVNPNNVARLEDAGEAAAAAAVVSDVAKVDVDSIGPAMFGQVGDAARIASDEVLSIAPRAADEVSDAAKTVPDTIRGTNPDNLPAVIPESSTAIAVSDEAAVLAGRSADEVAAAADDAIQLPAVIDDVGTANRVRPAQVSRVNPDNLPAVIPDRPTAVTVMDSAPAARSADEVAAAADDAIQLPAVIDDVGTANRVRPAQVSRVNPDNLPAVIPDRPTAVTVMDSAPAVRSADEVAATADDAIQLPAVIDNVETAARVRPEQVRRVNPDNLPAVIPDRTTAVAVMEEAPALAARSADEVAATGDNVIALPASAQEVAQRTNPVAAERVRPQRIEPVKPDEVPAVAADESALRLTANSRALPSPSAADTPSVFNRVQGFFSDSYSKVADTVSDFYKGAVETAQELNKAIPAQRPASIDDFPRDLIGKRVSWTNAEGTRVSGVVESITADALKIDGVDIPIPLSQINGASVSVIRNGNRLASPADFPDELLNKEVSFFTPTGRRLTHNGHEIKQAILLERKNGGIVLGIPRDAAIRMDPNDPSTFIRLPSLPYSRINGDSVVQLKFGRTVDGVPTRLATAEDFTGLQGQRISFMSPYAHNIETNVYLADVITDGSNKGIRVFKPVPPKRFDPANPSTYEVEDFYFSSKRIHPDSIVVTERMADGPRAGGALTLHNQGRVNLPVVMSNSGELTTSQGRALTRKIFDESDPNYELLGPRRELVETTERIALESPAIEGSAIEVTTDLVPTRGSQAQGTAVQPKVFTEADPNYEVLQRGQDVAVRPEQTRLEGRLIDGEATEVVGDAARLPARSQDAAAAERAVVDGSEETGTAIALRQGNDGAVEPFVHTGEIADDATDLARPRTPPRGDVIDGTVARNEPRFFGRLTNRVQEALPQARQTLGDLYTSARAKLSSFWSRLRRQSPARRAAQTAVVLNTPEGADAPTPATSGELNDGDNVTLEEEVDGPEGPTDPVTDPPPFETGRDDDGDDDETEEEPFQPLIAPAPRGNPVQPQFIQTISPTIHVKMGTY